MIEILEALLAPLSLMDPNICAIIVMLSCRNGIGYVYYNKLGMNLQISVLFSIAL
jgi:hypothetical protein